MLLMIIQQVDILVNDDVGDEEVQSGINDRDIDGKNKGWGEYISGRFVLQGAAQQMNDIFVTF